MEYKIIDAAIEHVPALEELEKLCFSTPWTEEMLKSQLPDDKHQFIVAVENDTLLGYVGMMHILDEGYISNVAVNPDFRRMGIADALIDELVERGRALELAFITLEVRESNEPARRLYSKHGFRHLQFR